MNTLCPSALFAPAPDRAVGEEAKAIRQAIEDVFWQGTSVSFKNRHAEETDAVLSAIRAAAASGAPPLRPEALGQAFTFLAALPPNVPGPEIAVEPDGQIGFDWHLAPNRSLSLNVGKAGMIGYAFLNGVESGYGRVPFVGALPPQIAQLLDSVLDQPHADRRSRTAFALSF